RMARKHNDCRLILAGGGAPDDPEGQAVLAEVREAAGRDPDIHVLELPPDAHLEINALQRAATIVIQKSIREGFGLAVSEAMWKGKPVVGGAVGGLMVQVIHDVTGYLVNSPEGAAFWIRHLLNNPELISRMGGAGREHVRRNFLVTRHLSDYLTLLVRLVA
ncbi:MAG: glycosyltransferase, partial [Candidatus Rokubacteria bacterium]|nr:glycosyltransferase [Candidatus Rokubacteria bacterium]